jgi:hypothetical protein
MTSKKSSPNDGYQALASDKVFLLPLPKSGLASVFHDNDIEGAWTPSRRSPSFTAKFQNKPSLTCKGNKIYVHVSDFATTCCDAAIQAGAIPLDKASPVPGPVLEPWKPARKLSFPKITTPQKVVNNPIMKMVAAPNSKNNKRKLQELRNFMSNDSSETDEQGESQSPNPFCKNKKSRAKNRPTDLSQKRSDSSTVICKNWHGSTESWINYCLEEYGVVPELKNKNTQIVSKMKEGVSINFLPVTGTFNLTWKKHYDSKIIPQLTIWLTANDPNSQTIEHQAQQNIKANKPATPTTKTKPQPACAPKSVAEAFQMLVSANVQVEGENFSDFRSQTGDEDGKDKL